MRRINSRVFSIREVFRFKNPIIIGYLGDHPKPAIEGHFKTGQR